MTCRRVPVSKSMKERGRRGQSEDVRREGIDADDRMMSGEETRTRRGLLLTGEKRRPWEDAPCAADAAMEVGLV